MPFCRECGKEVETDWVTCPYCSQSIGPHTDISANISASIVMGDVTTINDSKSITTAVKAASKCTNCSSIGTTQMACSICKNIAFCSVCISEIISSRKSFFAKPGLLTRDELKSGNYKTQSKKQAEFIEKRLCKGCFSVDIEDQFSKCVVCELFSTSSDNICRECAKKNLKNMLFD